tara:strand:- start:649 stop:879 length:231 start_codon:yes stop_codon:yes gene_type:complete
MKMTYKKEGKNIEYRIATDPVEAVNWSTYRLKISDIKIDVKLDKKIKAEMKREILNSILETEPNPSKKTKKNIEHR